MATDLSLLRLREVLDIAVTHCDAALNAIELILSNGSAQTSVPKWWKEHGQAVKAATHNASDAKRAVFNAESLCERLELTGDAGFLGHAGGQLTRCFDEFERVYGRAIKAVPDPSIWPRGQARLWTEFKFALIAARNAARAALGSRVLQETGANLTPTEARNKLCFEHWQAGKTLKELNTVLKHHPEWEHFDDEKAVRGAIKAWAKRIGVEPRRGHPGRPPK